MTLTLEGRIEVSSGKLIVIDPAYLVDFDTRAVDQNQRNYRRYSQAITRADREAHNNRGKVLSDTSLPRRKQMELLDKINSEKDRRIKDAYDTLSLFDFRAPYVLQDVGSVFLRVPKGYFPGYQQVNRESDHMHIHMHGGECDGTYQGHIQATHSKLLVVTDANTVSFDSQQRLHVIFSVEPGNYSCRYGPGSRIMHITRS